MIICPHCGTELSRTETALTCSGCAYSAAIRDGIVYFNPETCDNTDSYDSLALDILRQAEKKHFWFHARKAFIKTFFSRHVPRTARIIEIGAGTGDVSRMLSSCGYDMAAGELHRNGIQYAQEAGIKNLYQFDLMKPPFKEHFDAVCLFDVLEHLDNDALAVKKAAGLLRHKGLVIATVPAFDWLWSREDTVGKHKRRYSEASIRKAFENAGLDIVETKYFFVSLLPLLYLRTILRPDDGKAIISKEREVAQTVKVMPGVNGILRYVMAAENFLQTYVAFPLGCSIAIVGRRPA